jgi:hypothetical protein
MGIKTTRVWFWTGVFGYRFVICKRDTNYSSGVCHLKSSNWLCKIIIWIGIYQNEPDMSFLFYKELTGDLCIQSRNPYQSFSINPFICATNKLLILQRGIHFTVEPSFPRSRHSTGSHRRPETLANLQNPFHNQILFASH